MTALIVAADSSSDRLIAAGLTLLAALALVAIVHRAMRGRAHKLPDALGGAELSPMLDTRLRFLRRVIEAAIIVVGLALALAQFTSLDRLAATVLASSAIAAAVVGFAVAPGPGQRDRRHGPRRHPAAAHRRPRDLRGRDGHRGGRLADLHVAAHGLRRAPDHPQRAPGRRRPAQRLDPLADGGARGVGLAGARRRRDGGAGGRRGARGDARRAHRRGHRHRASACRSPARPWRRPSASRARASFGQRSCGPCAKQGVGDPATNPDLPFQGS